MNQFFYSAVVFGIAFAAPHADGQETELESVQPPFEQVADPAAEQELEETVPEQSESVRARVFPLVNYRREDGTKKLELLDVLVGEAYSYERKGERKRVKILDLPLVSLLESEQGPSRRSLKILDVPFFTLLETESKASGEFDNRFVKIPIFGSLFRHKRTQDEEKIRFLFFKKTRRLRGGGEKAKPEPRTNRQRQRRGK